MLSVVRFDDFTVRFESATLKKGESSECVYPDGMYWIHWTGKLKYDEDQQFGHKTIPSSHYYDVYGTIVPGYLNHDYCICELENPMLQFVLRKESLLMRIEDDYLAEFNLSHENWYIGLELTEKLSKYLKIKIIATLVARTSINKLGPDLTRLLITAL